MEGAQLSRRSVAPVDDAPVHEPDGAAAPSSRSWTSVVAYLVVIGILVWAFLLRVLDLNHVPGLNGDEAWYGVQLERLQNRTPVAFVAPSGRLSSNVFLALLLAPVQFVAGPAVWVLRIPSVIAGVLTVGLAFFSLRGSWGRTTALSAALILAGLPVTIAYSRFGWDPSLLGPFLVLVIAFAGRGKWPAAMVAAAAAILVHPTAIFALPLIWALVLGTDVDRGRRPSIARLVRPGLASAGLLVLSQLLGGARHAIGPMDVLHRATDLGGVWAFTVQLFSLFSGLTVHSYLVSAHDPALGWRILESWALLTSLAVVTAGVYGAFRHRSYRDLGLLLGTITSLLLLYLSSGNLAGPTDGGRYVIYAVPAIVLAFVVALKHCVFLSRTDLPEWRGPGRTRSPGFTAARRAGIAAVLALSVALLTVTTKAYFQPLRHNGSTTHEAFYVAAIDPKEQAWQVISTQPGYADATVYCQNWWSCYPLEYLAGAVAHAPTITPLGAERQQWRYNGRAGDFIVVRSGSPADKEIITRQLRAAPDGSDTRDAWYLVDVRGRPVYTVYRL
jgi:dolichyl-phosphate-mannose-protein mannosyltransferase